MQRAGTPTWQKVGLETGGIGIEDFEYRRRVERPGSQPGRSTVLCPPLDYNVGGSELGGISNAVLPGFLSARIFACNGSQASPAAR